MTKTKPVAGPKDIRREYDLGEKGPSRTSSAGSSEVEGSQTLEGELPGVGFEKIPGLQKQLGTAPQSVAQQGFDAAFVSRTQELLPSRIVIETPTLAIAANYYYAVRDGKLYRKPNPDSTDAKVRAEPQTWSLWGKDGLPYDVYSGKTLVDAKAEIVEVRADGDTVVAIADTKSADANERYRVYVYQMRSGLKETLGLHKGNTWYDVWGSPAREPLFLPKHLFRNGAYDLATRTAHTMGYFEDPVGNKIKAGGKGVRPNDKGEYLNRGLIHIYGISADGTRLHYADTGLPSTFLHEFDMPERGTFIAESVAASASTVFLIGKGGLYTAIRDYDFSGNNPMFFDYHYEPTKSPYDLDDPRSVWGPLNLGREPWKKHALVAIDGKTGAQVPLLSGQAVLTRNITMLLTGQGNSGREMRVQGRDPEGRYGYYTKQIDAEAWQFVETGQRYDPATVLLTAKNAEEPAPVAPSRDIHLDGKVSLAGIDNIRAELVDFNPVCSPAKVRLHLDGGTTMDLVLHTVDAWAPHAPTGAEGSDIPRLQLGTLDVPDAYFASQDPKVRKIAEALRGHDLKPFSFFVESTGSYVRLEHEGLDGDIDFQFGDCTRALSWNLGRNDSDLKKIREIAKIIDDTQALDAVDKKDLEEAIAHYKALRAKLQTTRSVALRRTIKGAVLSTFVGLFQVVTMITGPYWIDRVGDLPSPKRSIRTAARIVHHRTAMWARFVTNAADDLRDTNEIVSKLERELAERRAASSASPAQGTSARDGSGASGSKRG